MRTFYIITIGVVLVVFGLLLYPTLNKVVGSVNVSVGAGFLPLTAAAVKLLPYAFLGFIGYIIIKMSGK